MNSKQILTYDEVLGMGISEDDLNNAEKLSGKKNANLRQFLGIKDIANLVFPSEEDFKTYYGVIRNSYKELSILLKYLSGKYGIILTPNMNPKDYGYEEQIIEPPKQTINVFRVGLIFDALEEQQEPVKKIFVKK